MPERLPSSVEVPSHYKHGNIVPWDFIRDQGLNFHMGSAVKYIARAGKKAGASKVSDLKKAIHCLQDELEYAAREARDEEDVVQRLIKLEVKQ